MATAEHTRRHHIFQQRSAAIVKGLAGGMAILFSMETQKVHLVIWEHEAECREPCHEDDDDDIEQLLPGESLGSEAEKDEEKNRHGKHSVHCIAQHTPTVNAGPRNRNRLLDEFTQLDTLSERHRGCNSRSQLDVTVTC